MLPPSPSRAKTISSRLIYNAGRIVTYIFLGAIFGVLGIALAIRGLQKELSIITGAVILLTILTGSISRHWLNHTASNFIGRSVRQGLKKQFTKKTTLSFLFIGMLNGFLPCGFVYLAVAGAAAAGSLTGSAAYMALFGLGTFPVMSMISIAANFFGQKFRHAVSKISIPVALALGVFLIYRGTEMKTSCTNHTQGIHTMSCPVLR
jgi:sulfite exporter TauE/SafE